MGSSIELRSGFEKTLCCTFSANSFGVFSIYKSLEIFCPFSICYNGKSGRLTPMLTPVLLLICVCQNHASWALNRLRTLNNAGLCEHGLLLLLLHSEDFPELTCWSHVMCKLKPCDLRIKTWDIFNVTWLYSELCYNSDFHIETWHIFNETWSYSKLCCNSGCCSEGALYILKISCLALIYVRVKQKGLVLSC